MILRSCGGLACIIHVVSTLPLEPFTLRVWAIGTMYQHQKHVFLSRSGHLASVVGNIMDETNII